MAHSKAAAAQVRALRALADRIEHDDTPLPPEALASLAPFVTGSGVPGWHREVIAERVADDDDIEEPWRDAMAAIRTELRKA